MANPVLDVSLVQNPAAPAVLNGNQVVSYTLTIKPDLTNGATAADVMAAIGLAGMTLTTQPAVSGTNTYGVTFSDISGGFNVNVADHLPTGFTPITITFSATVNPATSPTTATAEATLNYQSVPATTDKIVYGTENGVGTGTANTSAQFYQYDVTTNTLSTVYSPGQAQDSIDFTPAKGTVGNTLGGIIFSGGDGGLGDNSDIAYYNIETGATTKTSTILFGDTNSGSTNHIFDVTESNDGTKVYFCDVNSTTNIATLYYVAIPADGSAPTAANVILVGPIATSGIAGLTSGDGVAGMAFTPNGNLYANYGTTAGQPYAGGNYVVQINPATGAVMKILTTISSTTYGKLELDGMCYDSYTGNIFAGSFTKGTTATSYNLFEINPTTGAVVAAFVVPTTAYGVDGIHSDGLGNIWIAGFHDAYYKLAMTSTAGTVGTVTKVIAAPELDDVVPITGTGSPNTYTTNTESSNTVACFMPGTAIATPSGAVAVEILAIGDLVLTSDGRAAPVLWIGRHAVAARFADPMRTLPIRIRAGALDENLPVRDLLISPCHAVQLGTILAQAGALVNGTSITHEADVPAIFTYYHVELEDHSLILAEGVPAETFVDNVDRMGFDNWGEHQALYTEGRSPRELELPRVRSVRQLPRAIRQHLAARSAVIGEQITLAA